MFVALDEASFFVSTEMGDRTAAEVYRATRPSIAQFGEVGQMIVSSSPSGPAGWFADHGHQVERGEMDGWRAWPVPTEEMNPRVPASFLRAEEKAYPETFASEYLAQFEGGSAFLDMQMVHIDSPWGSPSRSRRTTGRRV